MIHLPHLTFMDWVGLVGAFAAVWAGIATTIQLVKGWNAPTREDLKPIQENTADTVDKLADVHGHVESMNLREAAKGLQDNNMRLAKKVGFSVSGENNKGDSLNVILMATDPTIVLLEIELLNEHGTTLGSVDCEGYKDEPLRYKASIPWAVVSNWYGPLMSLTRLQKMLRAHMLINDQVVYREFQVTLFTQLKPMASTPAQGMTISITGSC